MKNASLSTRLAWCKMENFIDAILLEASYQIWIVQLKGESRAGFFYLMYGKYPDEMCDCMDCSIAGEPTH